MSPQSPKATLGLHWLAWVFLNTVAVAFGYALASPVASAGLSVGLQVTDRTITMVMIVLIGLGLAVAQWLLVRRQIDRAAIWLPVTFLGWAAPIFLVKRSFIRRKPPDTDWSHLYRSV
jgi:hypothetical protein